MKPIRAFGNMTWREHAGDEKPLEVWDEHKQKYVLYRNETEHREDGLRFPLS